MSSEAKHTQEVWAEFTNGKKECVDSADSENEALHLLAELRLAYGGSVKQMWLQLKRD